MIVKGDMVGDLGEAHGVCLANGPAKSLEDIATTSRCEAELILAVENAGGLGVDLLVHSQQAQSGPHGVLPDFVVVRTPDPVRTSEFSARNHMVRRTEPRLGFDALEDECHLVDPCADLAWKV